jgi:hypothetical protein
MSFRGEVAGQGTANACVKRQISVYCGSVAIVKYWVCEKVGVMYLPWAPPVRRILEPASIISETVRTADLSYGCSV